MSTGDSNKVSYFKGDISPLTEVLNMEDYVKIFFYLLLSVSMFHQCSLASEELEAVCGFPGSPAYGYVKPDQETYDDGDVVTYSCRVGYILLGTPVSTCKKDGSWSEDVPICDDSMTTLGIASSSPTLPGHPADMAIDRDRETCTYLKPKRTRWWRIDLGDVHKILSVAITISSTDDYMKFTVYVVEIQGNSADYKHCDSFSGKFGSHTLLLACDEGKGLEGQMIHIEDRRLDNILEICEVEVQVGKDTGYDCGRPDRRPFSMTYEPDDDKVEYVCQTGYELIGDSVRECLSSGHWSGEPPLCKPIVCEALGTPENGDLTYSEVDGHSPLEGSTAMYKCNYGYELDGSFTRHCLKDGSWSGKNPVCKVIRCPIPEGKHDGEFYRLLNKTNRVGSVAKLRCRKGIIDGHDPYITCTEKGEWTKPNAECIPQAPLSTQPKIVNRGGIIFGMAAAAIMMVIILAAFFIVKRRRDANKPELPSRHRESPAPPPRPPPRAKGLRSALMDLVSRDSSAHKYESLNLENGEGKADWKTRSLPLEPGNNEGITNDLGAPRRTLSYDDPEKLASRGTGAEYKQEKQQQKTEGPSPEEKEKEAAKQDDPEEGRVTTPVKSSSEYAAVDYDRKRQSRLLKEQDSEGRSQEASPTAYGEQLRELPPIPKEEEEEEEKTRTQSAEAAPSPSTDKEKEQEEAASEESEDVSLPIAPSDSQTSEAPTPSPDVVIENQVEGPSASPSTTPSESTPGRPRRRGDAYADQPSAEEAAETGRIRTRRRTEPEKPESPPPAPTQEERPSRRARAGRVAEPESPPAAPTEEERPTRRGRAGRVAEPESPPAAPADEERPTRRGPVGRPDEPESPPAAAAEEERPTRRTRPWAAGRFETPSTTSQPSYRRRY